MGENKKTCPQKEQEYQRINQKWYKNNSRLIQTLHALLISISSEVIITGDFRFVNCFFVKIRISLHKH